MQIIADPNIPLLERFNHLGEIITVPGRDWTSDLVRDADVLLTRSVTKVDAGLLENSCVKFIGTATSGFDHVDIEYLNQRDIYFSYCPGSNANSVAEYILSALFAVTTPGHKLKGMRAGIIGCGHVGTLVEQKLKAVGIECVLNDPPLRDQTGDGKYRSLEAALSADIVTLHTPLTSEGKYPTRALITDQQLQQMKPDVILINAARGGVVDEDALLQRMKQHPQMKTVIDCWQNEPDINKELLKKVTLGTPHIAGYSDDGKEKATQMLYDSLCDFLKLAGRWQKMQEEPECLELCDNNDPQQIIQEAVFSAFDIRSDAGDLKGLLNVSDRQRRYEFDHLRKDYPVRREFDHYCIRLKPDHDSVSKTLKQLGFQLVE